MEKPRMTEIHSQDTLHFIRTHRREDVRLLALQAHRYPSVDMPAAITQIDHSVIHKYYVPVDNHHRTDTPDKACSCLPAWPYRQH